ncbi:MAG TPA: ABC transporter permease [Bryobacteraceae bacterium]|nr:ABC transporter permease [Bryobacteraceae bacterium]
MRFGCRTLAKNPAFALVAILTLALGIGANTAIFNLLDAALLRALPVPHPEELTLLTDPESHGRGYGSQSGDRSLLAFWEFRYLHDHNDVFTGLFAADSQLAKVQATISRGNVQQENAVPEQVKVRLVSGGYFPGLGITPIAGHFFGSEADRAKGASPFAVIAYSFWEHRFSRDPTILGTKISIHHTPFEIIAVAPPGFFGETVGEAPDLWVPLMMQDAIYPGWDLMLSMTPGVLDQQIWLQVMGRRKPGITLRQANADIAIVFGRAAELAEASLPAADRREYPGERLILRAGAPGASVLSETFGEPLRVLMALVGLMLLIACANVANLLLARGAAREKEFALRLAIGAGRGQAIRQLLTESFLLAVPGAVTGLVLAQWADSLLLRTVPGASGRPGDVQLNIHPDARVLLFTAGIAVVTSILFGLAPALRLARLDLSEALKSGPGAQSGGASRSRLPIGKLLVIAQVAASIVMLTATGLFVRSLIKLSQVDVGFNREHLLEFDVDPLAAGVKGGAAATEFHKQLVNRLSSVPGVRSATLSGNGLFEGGEAGDPIAVEGYTPQTGDRMNSRMDLVGPDYFSTVGIPVLMGREIGARDSAGERVAVISQAFAQRFFPHSNPIGKHVRDTYVPSKPTDMTIVGVVADARSNTMREKIAPRLYAPFFQPLWQNDAAHYELRTFGDPASVATALRRTVSEAAPDLPPIEISSVRELVDNTLARDRLVARLSAAFGVLAMLLASIGLYGVMAWTMARRTREIGVRMALGARPRGIFGLVLRDTLLMVAIGIATGIPLALAAARLIQGLLFGVGAADPLVIAVASILLIAVALLAGYLPARRAARVDPMIALRHE